MVGETGFEPVLSSSRTTRAARLRYSPIGTKNRCSESLAGGPEQRWKNPPDTPGYVMSRRAIKAIDGMAMLCLGHCPSSLADCHS